LSAEPWAFVGAPWRRRQRGLPIFAGDPQHEAGRLRRAAAAATSGLTLKATEAARHCLPGSAGSIRERQASEARQPATAAGAVPARQDSLQPKLGRPN